MQTWTIHLEGGPRRVNHAAVAIGDRIFSFGGYCTGEDYVTNRPMDVHILNTVSYRWIALPLPHHKSEERQCVPYQRYGHTAVAVGDCAYIWGGRNDKDGACNVLFCFDSTVNKWKNVPVQGMKPGARDGHSACVSKNKMYVFGGYEEGVDRFSDDVFSFDFETLTWSLLHVMGQPAEYRDFHSATCIGENMYVFGGRSDSGGPYHTNREVYYDSMHVFNTRTHTWSMPATLGIVPRGRRSHSAFVHNDELFIFGGYNGCDDLHFGDMFKFSPARLEWSRVLTARQGPCSRRRQCCCLVGTKLYLFGGTSPCLEPMDQTEFNLMDHSDLHVLDFRPSLKTLCMLAVLDDDLDRSQLPQELKMEFTAMTTNNCISRPLNSYG